MNRSDPRPTRTALIPWVIALVALFGMNAFVQDHSRIGKGDFADGMGLSQVADDAQILGRVASPQAYLAMPPSTKAGFLGLTSSLLGIEICRIAPAFQAARGALRGRAPPAVWLA